MIVSHKHKFVFIHIPKCAGFSITHALKPILGEDDIAIEGVGQHSFARTIKEKYFESDDQWRGYFRFAIMRNPWARMHSVFYYNKHMSKTLEGRFEEDNAWHEYLKTVDHHRSFQDAIREDLSSKDPQSLIRSFCFDEKGRNLVTFIGKMEPMELVWEHICGQIGVSSKDVPLKHENRTPGKPLYLDEYDEESKAIVGRVFQYDINFMDYKFAQSIIATSSATTT